MLDKFISQYVTVQHWYIPHFKNQKYPFESPLPITCCTKITVSALVSWLICLTADRLWSCFRSRQVKLASTALDMLRFIIVNCNYWMYVPLDLEKDLFVTHENKHATWNMSEGTHTHSHCKRTTMKWMWFLVPQQTKSPHAVAISQKQTSLLLPSPCKTGASPQNSWLATQSKTVYNLRH